MMAGHDLYTAFNFLVEIDVPTSKDGSKNTLCQAGFAECDGLEMNITPKTIREGGNNGRQIHLASAVSYGQLSLKRGMTDNFDLWNWFEDVHGPDGREARANGRVVMLSGDGREMMVFMLDRCMPIKIKAPALNAKDGQIAIEEFQLVYEMLNVKRGSGKPQAGGS